MMPTITDPVARAKVAEIRAKLQPFAEYQPYKFLQFMNEAIQYESEEATLILLMAVKNEIIGQTAGFKMKLLKCHREKQKDGAAGVDSSKQRLTGILEMMARIMETRKEPAVIKEVSSVVMALVQIFEKSESPDKDAKNPKLQRLEQQILADPRIKGLFKAIMKSLTSLLASSNQEGISSFVYDALLTCILELLKSNMISIIDLSDGVLFGQLSQVLALPNQNMLHLKAIITSQIISTVMSKQQLEVPVDNPAVGLKEIDTLLSLKNDLLKTSDSLVSQLLNVLITDRHSCSDECIISVLQAMGWLAKNLTQFLPIPAESIDKVQDNVSMQICEMILKHPNALNSILDLFKYPHKSIKILAASLLSSLRYAVATSSSINSNTDHNILMHAIMAPERLNTFKQILLDMINESNWGYFQDKVNQEHRPRRGETTGNDPKKFINICDTIIVIVSMARQDYKNESIRDFCKDIGLIDRVWSYRKFNMTKVLQVLIQLTSESKESIIHAISIPDLKDELEKSVLQNGNYYIKYWSIRLLQSLCSTEDRLQKNLLIDKREYVSHFAEVLESQDPKFDYSLKIQILKTIFNMLYGNQRVLGANLKFFEILVKFFDDAVDCHKQVLEGKASLNDLRKALIFANKSLKLFQQTFMKQEQEIMFPSKPGESEYRVKVLECLSLKRLHQALTASTVFAVDDPEFWNDRDHVIEVMNMERTCLVLLKFIWVNCSMEVFEPETKVMIFKILRDNLLEPQFATADEGLNKQFKSFQIRHQYKKFTMQALGSLMQQRRWDSKNQFFEKMQGEQSFAEIIINRFILNLDPTGKDETVFDYLQELQLNALCLINNVIYRGAYQMLPPKTTESDTFKKEDEEMEDQSKSSQMQSDKAVFHLQMEEDPWQKSARLLMSQFNLQKILQDMLLSHKNEASRKKGMDLMEDLDDMPQYPGTKLISKDSKKVMKGIISLLEEQKPQQQ